MLSILSKVQKILLNSVRENATKILFAAEIQQARLTLTIKMTQIGIWLTVTLTITQTGV